MENDSSDITRNGLAVEHPIVTPPDATLRTERTTKSTPTGDAPTNVPAENVPNDGVRTDTTSPDVAGDAALTDIAIEEPLPEIAVSETLAGITAGQIVRDKRKSWKSLMATDAEVQVVSSDTKTVRQVVRERFARACDSSIRKRLASLVFEPASPFDSKVPRQFRLETRVLGSMLAATAVAIALFNICARLGR